MSKSLATCLHLSMNPHWLASRLATLTVLLVVTHCSGDAGSPWPFYESRTFAGLPLGPAPRSWAIFGGDWRIAAGEATPVLQQTQEPLYQEAFALATWSSYEVEAQAVLNSVTDSYGFGLVGH